MSATAENAIVRDLTLQSAAPKELEPGTIYALPSEDGALRIVDTFAYGVPIRPAANRTVRDVRSLLEYLDKHTLAQTEVWADRDSNSVTAVIDAHEGAGLPAGNGAHRVSLGLVLTEEWKTWNAANKVPMNQAQFANFIEENALDIVEPSAATFLEIAMTLQGTVGADYKNAIQLDNGQMTLNYEEKVTTAAGKNGDLTVPKLFKLALKPYVGGPTYAVTARLRVEPRGGSLTITFLLDRPHAVLENAFEDIIQALQLGVDSETVVVEEGGDGQPGKELHLPAVPGHTPILFGKP